LLALPEYLGERVEEGRLAFGLVQALLLGEEQVQEWGLEKASWVDKLVQKLELVEVLEESPASPDKQLFVQEV